MKMQQQASKTATDRVVVASWNEWDPLRHVIVGVADQGCIPLAEPAVEYRFPNEGGVGGMCGHWPAELIARANEELDNLADLMRKRGIRVDRPTPIDFNQPVATPDFTHPSM